MKTVNNNHVPSLNKTPSINGTPHVAKVHDEKVMEAHRQADHDIELDPDFQIHSRTHDLDEGEIARLGEE